MVKINPYLLVSNGKEAIEYYKKVFDAKLINHMPWSEESGKQMGLPDNFDYENSTMHAEISISDNIVMLADSNSPAPEEQSTGEVVIAPDSQEQIETFYNNATKNGSTILMKLQKQFWGSYFARFKDPYGVGWALNYTPPSVKLNPYLYVSNSKKAIDYYKKVFDAKLLSHVPFSEESGKQMGFPDNYDYENSTMHAEISISDNIVMLSDGFSPTRAEQSTAEVMITPDSEKQIKTFYNNAKKHGSTVLMELTKQFWGAYFTRFKDPYGVGWQLNFTIPEEETKEPPKKPSKAKKSTQKRSKKRKK